MDDTSEIMDLGTLAPVEVSVKIDGKPYLLREATADDAAEFKNAAMGGAKLDDGKVVGIGKAANAEIVLVGRCLHSLQEGGQWKPVGVAFVRALPARIVSPLYDRARAISHLDKGNKAEDEAGKGGPAPTGDTST